MAKYAAKGASFQWTISASLTTIAQVKSIRTSESVNIIDTTDLSDTSRTKVVGIADHGRVTLELEFDPDGTGYAAMRTDWVAGTSRAAKIIWPDTTPASEAFTAFVTSIERGGGENTSLTASIELEITGARTLA